MVCPREADGDQLIDFWVRANDPFQSVVYILTKFNLMKLEAFALNIQT